MALTFDHESTKSRLIIDFRLWSTNRPKSIVTATTVFSFDFDYDYGNFDATNVVEVATRLVEGRLVESRQHYGPEGGKLGARGPLAAVKSITHPQGFVSREENSHEFENPAL